MDYKEMDEEERMYRDKELPPEHPTPEQCAIMGLEQEILMLKDKLAMAQNDIRSNAMAIFEMQELKEMLENLYKAHLKLQDHMLDMYKMMGGK